MKLVHLVNFLFILLYAGVAFAVGISLFPTFTRWVKKFQWTQKIRSTDWTGKPALVFQALHQHKAGTPTMGGVVMVLAILATVAFSGLMAGFFDWPSLIDRGQTYLPLFTLLVTGALGVLDDWLNIREKNSSKGLSVRVKFWSLVGFACLGAAWFLFKLEWSILHIPFWGDLDIGAWYALLFVLVIVSTANSVNLTDGLDGLAAGLLALAYVSYGVLAYSYDLTVLSTFCFVVGGALVSFLWFNVPPASLYMGDSGSLALGATLGVIAMLTNAVLLLGIIGLIFVVEALSAILQWGSKKFRGKKLFLVAPLHHHFEAKGWSETQIVMRFWIIGAGCAGLGVLFGLLG